MPKPCWRNTSSAAPFFFLPFFSLPPSPSPSAPQRLGIFVAEKLGVREQKLSPRPANFFRSRAIYKLRFGLCNSRFGLYNSNLGLYKPNLELKNFLVVMKFPTFVANFLKLLGDFSSSAIISISPMPKRRYVKRKNAAEGGIFRSFMGFPTDCLQKSRFFRNFVLPLSSAIGRQQFSCPCSVVEKQAPTYVYLSYCLHNLSHHDGFHQWNERRRAPL